MAKSGDDRCGTNTELLGRVRRFEQDNFNKRN